MDPTQTNPNTADPHVLVVGYHDTPARVVYRSAP